MLLETRGLRVHYGGVEVLKGVSLSVEEGRSVCLLGANGAGKSTTMRAISNLVPLSDGEIYFEGQRIDGLPSHHVVRKGVVQVPEERRLFSEMTVKENLEMGAYLVKGRFAMRQRLDEVMAVFPWLERKLKQQAGTLSGGEQQMAAIGRALMGKPRLLLMDEPSLGLSPILCDTVIDCIMEIKKRGTGLLLSEQNAELALQVTDEAYIMQLGEIVLHGTSKELAADERISKAYFGI